MMSQKWAEGSRQENVGREEGRSPVPKEFHLHKIEVIKDRKDVDKVRSDGMRRKRDTEMQELLDDIARYQELAEALQRQLVEAGKRLVESEQELNAANMCCERLEEEIERLRNDKTHQRLEDGQEDGQDERAVQGLQRRLLVMQQELSELRRRNVELELKMGHEQELREALEHAESSNNEYKEQLVNFGRINRSMTEKYEKELRRMKSEQEVMEEEMKTLKKFRERWEEEERKKMNLVRIEKTREEGICFLPYTCQEFWKGDREKEEKVEEVGKEEDGKAEAITKEKEDPSPTLKSAVSKDDKTEEVVKEEQSETSRQIDTIKSKCELYRDKGCLDLLTCLKTMNEILDSNLAGFFVPPADEKEIGTKGDGDSFFLLRQLTRKFLSFISFCCVENEKCVIELISLYAVIDQVKENFESIAFLTPDIFININNLVGEFENQSCCLRDRSVKRLLELKEKVAVVLSNQNSELKDFTGKMLDVASAQTKVMDILETAKASCDKLDEEEGKEDVEAIVVNALRYIEQKVQILAKMIGKLAASSSLNNSADDLKQEMCGCLEICDLLLQALSGDINTSGSAGSMQCGSGVTGEMRSGAGKEERRGEDGGEQQQTGGGRRQGKEQQTRIGGRKSGGDEDSGNDDKEEKQKKQEDDKEQEEQEEEENWQEEDSGDDSEADEEIHRIVFSQRKCEKDRHKLLSSEQEVKEEETGARRESMGRTRRNKSVVEVLLEGSDSMDFDAMLDINESLQEFIQTRKKTARGGRAGDISLLLSPPAPSDPTGDDEEQGEAEWPVQGRAEDATEQDTSSPPPPPAWATRISRRWRRAFFVHMPSRRTQWKYPEERELRRGQLVEELRTVEVQLEVKSLTGLWVSWENVRRVLEGEGWRHRAAVRTTLLAVAKMKRKEMESSWV
ncbi:hypothetical protein GUITHDRAFT_148165 [Guillardia theta CCMP2712]|uniref:WW domain-containing protein n=1 Tax=Guillardia theta (strain CCMP2712) TaxID=905079 RepID=L1IB82_GUITC|nr:hypothetical protein GUITHDRAFT_148165 [Guillardia theta CCMP2712]EKX33105.1 hypothetical protein GUITHDRAFT_148165 [Guillardia theta CCMP2712]|eukprot:XP_005820085.1 hypothetical protein GUITHDRAFT_148165 [Guillardia theta CCMP2712]